jgi:hypothetical protein
VCADETTPVLQWRKAAILLAMIVILDRRLNLNYIYRISCSDWLHGCPKQYNFADEH